ncbi:hypothetical protein EDC61_10994 [Sulfuritortus calidifontis]|uniref:DnrO protein n=1 Tax=Sulfuritortus calidifontis TaxID=1914471 RepID=A0A4R3JUQ4_9PROT|nr:hypothetical protein [Sulfuritortus calidifontis]TCS71548.1 hypothetical protein EDC61_10994 [Sulfuritortus calidifontis]
MKRTLCLIALLVASLPSVAAEHRHDHGAAPQQLQLDAGKPWAIDAPLRQAMDNINGAMKQAIPRIHSNRFTNEDYRKLGEAVDKEIAYAVANCKLEPKADAMLHLVIAELSAGAEAMQGKGRLSPHAGAVKVIEALHAYGRFFQHPGWVAAGGK